MNLNEHRKIDPALLGNYPIIKYYSMLLDNQIKVMPRGTWQNDINVIVITRYVLEVRLALPKDEIPKINRNTIMENKLWGILNRFKSIRKLIHFVYPGKYHECDFYRVPVDYWSEITNIKDRFEWKLAEENLNIADIPSFITCPVLIKWGFSNPLKRYGDSPFRLINAMYPNLFKETDFKNPPQRFRKDIDSLKQQILEVLRKENIELTEVPEKVTHKVLYRNRLSGVLSLYSSSTSKLFCTLFPEYFTEDNFTKPNGYWDDIENARLAIEKLLTSNGISFEDIPTFITKKRLKDAKLGGLLHRFRGSPIEIIQALYPEKFFITDFQRVPNKYWYKKEHRIQAMRDYCKKQSISRNEIPLLNRAYFRKHFPRFISIADRHYDSKFYKWIIESFPEYRFEPTEFQLLVGSDGQICDSKEELVLHNFFINTLLEAEIEREEERFNNIRLNETYLPDWIINQNGQKFIVEYFGLYGSDLYPGYSEKTTRKIDFYRSIKEYQFIAIFPKDFKEEGFDRLIRKLEEAKILVKN